MADMLDDAQVRSHQDVRHRLSSRGGLLLASLAPGRSERDQARALLGLNGIAGVGGSANASAPAADKLQTLLPASSSTPKLDAFRRRYDEERRQRRVSAAKDQKKAAALAVGAIADGTRATPGLEPDPKSVSVTTPSLVLDAVEDLAHTETQAKELPAPPAPQTKVAVGVSVAGDVRSQSVS